jgi:hypothetical protein
MSSQMIGATFTLPSSTVKKASPGVK